MRLWVWNVIASHGEGGMWIIYIVVWRVASLWYVEGPQGGWGRYIRG